MTRAEMVFALKRCLAAARKGKRDVVEGKANNLMRWLSSHD